MPLRDTILLRPRGCRFLRRCEGNWSLSAVKNAAGQRSGVIPAHLN